MRNVLDRYKVYLGLAALLVVTGSLVAAMTTQAPPASPSVQYLAKWGISVQPLSRSEAVTTVSKTVAVEAVDAAARGFSLSNPMATELVQFSDVAVPSLVKPQPAWLVTWDETTYPHVPAGSTGALPAFHHMTAVVSATTGKLLEMFSSP